jgi:hypothetical protein
MRSAVHAAPSLTRDRWRLAGLPGPRFRTASPWVENIFEAPGQTPNIFRTNIKRQIASLSTLIDFLFGCVKGMHAAKTTA